MFDWVLEVVAAGGALGVFFLMVLENLFPPIPSELIMPLAGFLCADRVLNPFAVMSAGTLGSVVGALPWYYLGRRVGQRGLERFVQRYGVVLTLTVHDLQKTQDWFQRRGWAAVLLGRLIPGVRTLISAPAGVVRMPMIQFLALTTIGSAAWVSLLTGAGYLLAERYHEVESWIDPLATGVMMVLVSVYIVRLVRQAVSRKF